MAHQPVPSTSQTRSLRERKKRKYDFDNTSSDDEPEQLKRATRRKPSGAPLVRRNKRSGKLASFVNMPLDVLYEIFGHLHPYDLLRLTRTTKEFRRILLHKSSISTWKSSFEHVPSLPECPPEMCEPAWANLAFSPHCHYCTATGTRHVEWKFRVRICSKCAPNQLIEGELSDSLVYLYKDIPGGARAVQDAIDGFPNICALVPNRGGKRYKRVFLRDHLVEFRDKITSLVKEEDRNAYLDERLKYIEKLNMHAANCEAWAHNQADDRNEELVKLRKERREAIVKKLEELGYKKDVQFRGTSIEIEAQPFANKPQRLTERIWKNIQPAAIAYIEQVRKTRLHAEHQDLVLSRKRMACVYLRNFKNSQLPCTDIFPEPPDFCEFEPVKRICNQPSDVVVGLSSFDVLNDSISDLIKRWRKDVHSGIRNVFLKNMTASFNAPGKFNLPDWMNDPVALKRKMSLASVVFVCEQCAVRGFDSSPFEDLGFMAGLSFYDDEDEYFDFDDTERCVKPMFYPQVMAHPCLTRFTLKNSFFLAELFESSLSNSKRDPTTHLDARLKQRKKWNSDRITLDKQGSKVAEKVVALAGLDPAQATTEEMDELDPRFKCTDCVSLAIPARNRHPSGPPPSENGMEEDDDDEKDVPDFFIPPKAERFPVMNWRAAIKHQIDRHVQGVDPGSMTASAHLRQPTIHMEGLRLLDPADPIIEDAKEEERNFLETIAEVWCCALCRDSTREPEAPVGLPELNLHFKHQHKLEDPVLDRDYYKHFAAVDIMNVAECVPWVKDRN